MAEDLPDGVVDHLMPAVLDADDAMKPIEPKSLAVMLDYMFAALPAPDASGLKVWRNVLSPYPHDLLAEAIRQVVQTHRWETVPKVAQVIDAIRPALDERQAWRNKLKSAQMKAKLTGKKPKPTGTLLRDQTPEQREAFFERMRAKYPGAIGTVERAMAPTAHQSHGVSE